MNCCACSTRTASTATGRAPRPVQVHAIRRALAQAPSGEQWIETLPKRGYRFVGPVSVAAESGSSPRERTPSNLPEAQTSFIGRERDLGAGRRRGGARRA